MHPLTIQGCEVLAMVTGGCFVQERGSPMPIEGMTTPYFQPDVNPCHFAANEPARPPESGRAG